ncbi:MAG: EVE domain-containing protein [Deltaproteobacteria bacterium]|nr:MAG: EVE domain-containing protein [Deltaproteobacteria bacterium]
MSKAVHKEPQVWAFFANPTRYRLADAVKNIEFDTWTTKGKAISVGDRCIFWQGGAGGNPRGIIAFGTVTEGPTPMPDHENPYWLTPPDDDDVEPRVSVRYEVPDALPLWLDEHEDVLGGLSVARARGGTVFHVHDDQWSSIQDLIPVKGGKSQPPVVGLPYKVVEPASLATNLIPFEVDPTKIERGNKGHCETQNALAAFLLGSGVEPRSPAVGDPEFDLAWEWQGTLYVAEVKSTTPTNEEKQLRLGLGQVLRYRQQLRMSEKTVVAVLVPEHEPQDADWQSLCADLDMILAWPGAFERVFQH